MKNERSTVIFSMLEKFKEGHGRDAMRMLHLCKGRMSAIGGFYDKVCELYYSNEWTEEAGKAKLNRYLLASAEYMRSIEAAEVAKAFLENVDEDIFGIEY